MTHTPGPWITNNNRADNFAPSVYPENYVGGVICNTRSKHRSNAECKANARLIAAAPELLSAAQELRAAQIDYMAHRGDNERGKIVADKAAALDLVIAKATKEQIGEP